MRLIDADALVTVQSYDPMNEEYSEDEMTVADALDFATEEGCPPTIDAIPVEWLEAKKTKLESNFMIGPRTAAKAIERLIRNWKDEQDGVR